jgi:hypothetical protein
MSQHRGMFTGTIILIGRWLFVIDDEGLERLHVARHVNTALKSAFLDANLLLNPLDCLHMQVTALVRSTRDRKLTWCKSKVFHAAAFDKGERLKRFCARAQKGDRLRVAIRRDQFSI